MPMPNFSRLSIRRKPTPSSQVIGTYQRQHQIDLERHNSLQIELRRNEQELYRRIEEEDRRKEENLQREKDELYKQQQIAFQIQEAESRRQEQLRQTTPRALLHLQDLIRKRHELDLEIWRKRNVSRENRDILVRMGKRADEIMEEIHSIVGLWEEGGWEPREWEVAKRIKQNIEAGNQRNWTAHPAWMSKDA